ncbi:hypothetical protein, partial [Klebsiella pneumoniae]|uniref:hypothetical protein n=1 Tax=Klebsiella pneumoniae TaxID=573 RepID=UPI00203310B6
NVIQSACSAPFSLLSSVNHSARGEFFSLRCRIGQTPQNDVSDAIPQRLPGDLQSVLVGEFYEKSSIQD